MKKFLNVALLLLLSANCCFGLDAAFAKEHACIPAGGTSFSCEIHPGDTLSKDALAVYGDWHLYSTIKDANPNIVDENKIYFGRRINIPETAAKSVATAIVATPRAQPRATVDPIVDAAPVAIANTVEDDSFTLLFAHAPIQVSLASPDVAQSPAPTSAPTSAKIEKTRPAKISGHQFVVSNDPNLQGKLQTQLVLFNSEEEKRLGLPIERIDLKPSLAIPARDGNTVVFVHLKKIPAQPFELLVGGITIPIDSTQIQVYNGKAPGAHVGTQILASIIKAGAPAGISFLAGGPIAAGIAVGVPRLVHLGIAWHDKIQERKLAAAQKAVDKSKLALYRASLESNALGNALSQKESQ